MFGPVGVLLLSYVVAEIVVMVVVAEMIGAVATLLLLAASSLLGVLFVRHQAARMMSNSVDPMVSVRHVDAAPLLDGVARLFAGVLMIIPGFVSTILGLALLLPPVRRLIRPVVFVRATGWTGFTKRFGADVIDVTLVDDPAPKPSQSTRQELG